MLILLAAYTRRAHSKILWDLERLKFNLSLFQVSSSAKWR